MNENLNLDVMSKNDLYDLYLEIENHSRLSAKKYNLPHADIVNIKCYAINKFTATVCRERGKIQEAQQYESICQNIYNRLSDLAQW
jgi:ribosomal protein L40E